MENSIEKDIKVLENLLDEGFEAMCYEEAQAIEHILSDYKRVLKENESYQKSDYETVCLENNELREITDRIQSEYNDLLKDNFKLKNELETKRKEYQETYKDVREEIKELKKENEELKQEKINNHKMIALAQNEALGYMRGYEDGKNSRTSAIASIVENQQYYIIKKQMEKYEEHIAKLQKENEELRNKLSLKQFDINVVYNDYLEKLNEYKENSISIQKVKDKIEKLNDESHAEKLEDIMIGNNYTITELVQYVLQELLNITE